MIWLSVTAFAVAWWLGSYLLARDPHKLALRRAGIGLVGYAVALAVVQFEVAWLDDVAIVLMCVPAVAWSGTFLALAKDASDRWWRYGVLPVFAALAVVVVAGVDVAPVVLIVVAVLALEAGVIVLLVRRPDSSRMRGGVLGLVVLAALMLGLGSALPLLGLDLVPAEFVLGAIAPDLIGLGVVVAVFDAFDEGQVIGPDMSRSALISFGAAVLFGGQVAVAIVLTGQRSALVLLLYGTVAAAIAVQVLMSPIQAAADRVTLRSSGVRRARGELRAVADALPRKDTATRLAELPADEFARLTRRAISHYGDLGKLVSSPLVDLPVIDTRLAERGVPDAPLERATELKAVLLAGITRLKPHGDEEFGTSEEWKHYNALYFYYVRGIRPYSVRTKRTNLDLACRQALAWFAGQVPERTLHNWQNAAARIIADDLRAGISSQRETRPARAPGSP